MTNKLEVHQITLKPCPFCGAADVAVFRNVCMCRACGAHSEDLGDMSFTEEECKQMAMDKWNQRA